MGKLEIGHVIEVRWQAGRSRRRNSRDEGRDT